MSKIAHYVDDEIARKIGIQEAMVLNKLKFLAEQNLYKDGVMELDEVYLSASHTYLHKRMSCINPRKIKRVMKRLRDLNLIIPDPNYKRGRVKRYRLNVDKITKMSSDPEYGFAESKNVVAFKKRVKLKIRRLKKT